MILWLAYLWQIVHFCERAMFPHKLESADEVVVTLDDFNVLTWMRLGCFLIDLRFAH